MLTWLKEMLDSLGQGIVSVFPLSPFAPYIDKLGALPFIGYINWFIPIGTFATIAACWGLAIGLYYAYSIIARWVKVIS